MAIHRVVNVASIGITLPFRTHGGTLLLITPTDVDRVELPRLGRLRVDDGCLRSIRCRPARGR